MIIPIVLSGGKGTRLWPLSREAYPKPFMMLSDGENLLHKTYQRAMDVVDVLTPGVGSVLTVTNRDYYFMCKDEFANLKRNEYAAAFLLEPVGRNTAPAIAVAAHFIAEKFGADAIMLILAADHLVQDTAGFVAAVAEAEALARQGCLVTFGIVPTRPETGFGYLEAGAAFGGGRKVSRFVEKPSLEKAQAYIATGNFFWNSGMFCFQAGVILEQMKCYAPDVAAGAQTCWGQMKAGAGTDSTMLELPADVFGEMPDISIDYAVMERSDQVVMVASDFGWSDIGNWAAVKELVQPDAAQNRVVGEAIFVDSHNTFVQSKDRLVAALGVDDLMIIDTPDALLVAHEGREQEVKKVVDLLKAQAHESYKLHRTVTRPWGTYTVLGEGSRFKIKRLEVKPGASLSLQMHHHRSEHWTVVSGMAKVINGEQEIFVGTNESTYIPAGNQHCLMNPGLLDLVVIEVQSGEYLGEDDIVRFKDSYGRC